MTEQAWSAESYIKRSPIVPLWTSQLLDVSVALLVFLTLIAFVPGWYAPSFAKWVVIALLSSLCWLGLAWAAKRGSLRVDAVDAVAAILFFWVLLSIRWSPDPLTGKDTAFHWAILLGVFFYLRRRTSIKQTVGISIAAAVGSVVVIAFEYLGVGSFGGYYNTNLETEMLLAAMPLFIPLAAALGGTRWRWYVLALAIGIGIYLIFDNTSKIEFAVWSVLGLFFSVIALARKSRRLALAAVAAGALLVVFVVALGWESFSIGGSKGFRASFLPRLEYSINTTSVWLTRPVQGVGAGGFNAIFPYHQDVHAEILTISKDTHKKSPLFEEAGAAHNDMLQFLANFGLIGILIVGAGIYLARSSLIKWRQSPERVAGLVVLLTVMTNAQLEFPLQMPATLLLFVIGLAWLLPLQQRSAESKVFETVIEFRLGVALVAIGAILTNFWWSWAFFNGHQSFKNTLATIFVDAQKALVHNDDAIRQFPYDDMFRRQYIITLMRWDETEKRRVVPPDGYDKAFTVALSVGPVTGSLILRLQYLLQSGRFLEQSAEVKRWRDLLLTQSSRVADVWLLEGVFRAQEGNRKALEEALARYDVLTNGVAPENRAPAVKSLRGDLEKLVAAEKNSYPTNK